MRDHYDIVIIGSGPAGLGAAIETCNSKITVAVFDEQELPGGQIYRSSENQKISNAKLFGPDVVYGSSLVKQFRNSNVDYFPNSTIWQLSKELDIGVSRGGVSHLVKARSVILATGALERPFPIKGWTLPGVSTVGGAQILLKSNGLVQDGAVLIGNGPLLYLLASQYLRNGVHINAILDTNCSKNKWRALKHLPKALVRFDLINQGQTWISEIKNSGIVYISNVSDLELNGTTHLDSVTYETENGQKNTIPTKKAFLHQGVSPNINLAVSAGCEHIWDTGQLCWKPRLAKNGETTVPGIFIVGDSAGIIGAKGSEASGHLVARNILKKYDTPYKQNISTNTCNWDNILLKELLFRPFIDALFKPRKNFRIPINNDVIICRCEEVTAKEIRKNVDLGCQGPNQMKAFCRAGMGPCQGRFCGLTVSELIADECQVPVSKVGYLRTRPPIKPLILGELANLSFEE